MRRVIFYSARTNKWHRAPDMLRLGSHREVLSEAYEPETNSWTPVSDGMVAGWRNPSISLNGQLYALDCRDGCKLRVYDGASDSWNKFIDSKLHLGSSHALEAAALVPSMGSFALCVTT
ncbi:hypothetical protein GH714_012685 [Hevea brasiliensis]|uniref:F-box/kelch-repeat protein n=1 Tax=Hevea brasiliensis TaxID=3981 RepID=A0A6A6KDM7_HEVBR|nr:hypothetical protein GH714_012685 [Hevea brasiliensis]